MASLSGPALEPMSGKATALVVLLHGYGANGHDLMALGYEWRSQLFDAKFVAPNAPEEMQVGFGGYQWFPLTLRDPSEFWRGAVAAAPALDAYIDAQLRGAGVDAKRLVLVGFSQGTMMALHVGLRRNIAPAAIVGYSGVIAGQQHLAQDMTCRPPVLLIHGDRDDLIPVGALEVTRDALVKAGIKVESHISPGLGHGIDADGLARAGRFIAKALSVVDSGPAKSAP